MSNLCARHKWLVAHEDIYIYIRTSAADQEGRPRTSTYKACAVARNGPVAELRHWHPLMCMKLENAWQWCSFKARIRFPVYSDNAIQMRAFLLSTSVHVFTIFSLDFSLSGMHTRSSLLQYFTSATLPYTCTHCMRNVCALVMPTIVFTRLQSHLPFCRFQFNQRRSVLIWPVSSWTPVLCWNPFHFCPAMRPAKSHRSSFWRVVHAVESSSCKRWISDASPTDHINVRHLWTIQMPCDAKLDFCCDTLAQNGCWFSDLKKCWQYSKPLPHWQQLKVVSRCAVEAKRLLSFGGCGFYGVSLYSQPSPYSYFLRAVVVRKLSWMCSCIV